LETVMKIVRAAQFFEFVAPVMRCRTPRAGRS
jgi:hypothetical protein